jgi:hypothetical protein
MKAQSYTLHTARPRVETTGTRSTPHWAERLPCLAFTALVSTLPPVALIILATWASNIPALLPYAQSLVGLTGLVFLALAVDSGKRMAALQTLSAAAMFALAYASMAWSPEFLVAGAMIVAAWAGAGLFSHSSSRCL